MKRVSLDSGWLMRDREKTQKGLKEIRLRTIATLLGLVCATVAYSQQLQSRTAVPNTGAVPNVIRFSGSFRPANGMPAQSVESVTLAVYRDQTGGTPLWQETQNVSVDGEGKYSVLMGSTQNEGVPLDLLSGGEPRWLGVQFNRPGEVEQTRVLMASVPYALKASDAETLGGKPASAYLLAGAGTANLAANGVPSGAEMAARGAAPPSAASTVTTVTDATTALRPRTISGQQGYVPYFTDGSNDLGDSVIQQANGFIGIGTVPGAGSNTTPSLDLRTYPFSQIGMAQTVDYLAFFSSDAFGPAIYWNPGKDLRFGKAGVGLYNAFGFVEQMRIQSATGNLGIGTMTPTAKLEVNGPAQVDGNLTITTSGNGLIFPDGSKQTTAAGGGGGGGSITGVTAGTDLTGGGTSGTVTLNVDTTKVPTLAGTNNFTGSNTFASGVVTNVVAGTGLTGGGTTPTATLNLDTTKVPTLAGANNFTATNTFTAVSAGSLGVSGTAQVGNLVASQNISFSGSVLYQGQPALQFPGSNTAVGSEAMRFLTTGADNTAVGELALGNTTSGGGNTGVGYLAGNAVQGGSGNTAIGYLALFESSGSNNIAIGASAGNGLTELTNSNNIDIGNAGLAGDGFAANSGVIRIGTTGTQTAFFAAGIRGATTGMDDAMTVGIDSKGQMGTIDSSRRFKEDIEDMGEASHDLLRLRPVTFRYKKPFANGSKPIQYGLIAEEVDEIYPNLVTHSADGQIESVKYQVLPAMLLNEVQRQQAEIGVQKEQLQKLEQQNQSLQERLDKLEAAFKAWRGLPSP